MSSPALTLAALEISIRRAGGTLSAQEHVVIHSDAHATTRIAPLESSVAKDFVQSLGFGFHFHPARARHHQGLLQI